MASNLIGMASHGLQHTVIGMASTLAGMFEQGDPSSSVAPFGFPIHDDTAPAILFNKVGKNILD